MFFVLLLQNSVKLHPYWKTWKWRDLNCAPVAMVTHIWLQNKLSLNIFGLTAVFWREGEKEKEGGRRREREGGRKREREGGREGRRKRRRVSLMSSLILLLLKAVFVHSRKSTYC